ncbi:2-oxoacid:acceptor oxidoreductase subunit alpha [Wansuia hejianensis]|uniref:2-oxoacid:acceptor oxidoreductase subunit alpha n=1 Tax=Wansuia hejianensis TaxID=2763667 RepID=A0A926IL50_9FIRM|nr:2-oxoacid:acceptor oxidoreductase subunit alpha [Wansuia hejianensis]MBC8589769.1 2-oxoacid:acceptor oxidoreductase subunit alpha [Wansuia hejianensis]
MKYNVLIGGAAGQGIDTLGILIEKILCRKGYFIHSHKDYMSRIRGGHNFTQIRFGLEPVYSHWPILDTIIGLDKETVEFHSERLREDGVIICDESIEVEDNRVIHIPMVKFAKEFGNHRAAGSVAAGAMFKIFGEDFDIVKEVFSEKFEKETADSNFNAFKKGYEFVEKNFEFPKPEKRNQILINSNDAIALGALAAGVGFFASYPMTPATSIMTKLSMKQDDAKIVVEQVEDEISAINMALGASYAGVRSMTATSGGGYSLMVEALSLQGITEIPIVVVDSQRPGPATGFPTRTEQGDLDFVLFSGHGEYPKMVIAVKNAEDAFYQTTRALNIADKYQVQVIILTDEYLADATQTIPPYDFSKVRIERYIMTKEELGDVEYKRYKPTEDGVSPRIMPGKIEGAVVMIDSDEHNEYGHITESAEVRTAMMNKRMRKMEGLVSEIQEPDYFGAENPEILLLGWGSMYGPIKEAVDMLNKDEISVGALIFGDLYPFPTRLLKKYSQLAKKLINVEMNFTGQLARLIRQETGIFTDQSILNYNGRQMDSYTIYSRIKEEVL